MSSQRPIICLNYAITWQPHVQITKCNQFYLISLSANCHTGRPLWMVSRIRLCFWLYLCVPGTVLCVCAVWLSGVCHMQDYWWSLIGWKFGFIRKRSAVACCVVLAALLQLCTTSEVFDQLIFPRTEMPFACKKMVNLKQRAW